MAEETTQAPPKKERKVDAPAGAPAWMVTYSDLVTLLLTFFVLLLSMASMDPVRFTEASSSLKDAFGIHRDPAHVEFAIPVLPSPPITQFSPVQMKTTERVYEKIKSQIDSLRLNNDIGVLKKDDDSIILRIKDAVLFGPGQSKIALKAFPILRNIGDIVRPLPMDLRIEGHTDDIPMEGSQFGNWDLSVERSVSVLRYFTHSDLLSLDRMAAVGYGKERPIVANVDKASRAQNRRVDFVLKLISNRSRGNAPITNSIMPL
ncbi:MAG: OmpA family protein [Desulfobulbaceae bacterium]|nr:OmpA family protein [Desulfobulbaceae bacterium]